MNEDPKTILLVFFCCTAFSGVGWGGEGRYDLWGSSGEHKVAWHEMDEPKKAFALERYKKNIDYCLSHLGQKFDDVEMDKVGGDKGFKIFTPAITYGVVAVKYQDDYNDVRLAAKYFYKDWLEFKKCEADRRQGRRVEGCFTSGSGPGDYDPLGAALQLWQDAGMYGKALSHYQEYFNDQIVGRCLADVPGGKEEKLKSLDRVLAENRQCREFYSDIMQNWSEAKELAKTAKPKPLDPAVQHHEWFYSPKTAEVLKALDYYNKNRVKFMVEKAAKHKSPVVARKAKEYLDNWDKAITDGSAGE